MGLGFTLDLTNVSLIVALVVLLFVLFAVTVCRFSGLVMLVLFGHNLGALGLSTLNGLLVLVLVMLHFLKMRYD